MRKTWCNAGLSCIVRYSDWIATLLRVCVLLHRLHSCLIEESDSRRIVKGFVLKWECVRVVVRHDDFNSQNNNHSSDLFAYQHVFKQFNGEEKEMTCAANLVHARPICCPAKHLTSLPCLPLFFDLFWIAYLWWTVAVVQTQWFCAVFQTIKTLSNFVRKSCCRPCRFLWSLTAQNWLFLVSCDFDPRLLTNRNATHTHFSDEPLLYLFRLFP